jgi:drug/metabolite transporter (DMT)-like permease
MSSSLHSAANRRGMACMSGAMVCFIVNDMLMKKLGESLPLPQLILVRGLVASLLLLAAAQATGALQHFASIADRRVLWRSLIDAVGSLAFLASLMHLPLANATAINLASPLVIAVLAVLLLGERAGPGRWLAVTGGFGGVLLIVQPSAAGFTGWAWVCLAATLCHASRDLMTRRIGAAVPALLVTLANAVCVSAAAGLWTSVSGWASIDLPQVALLGLAALMLSGGYWLIVLAMQAGEMTVVAPFRYVGLLAAVLLGWLVWGDLPDALATAGIGLLLASGLYLLHEQRTAARTAAATAAAGPVGG